MNAQQVAELQGIITNSLRNKLANYNPESKHMPFHTRLLGKDRMALYSFIQSLNTTFGISIFEPVAVYLGSTRFRESLRNQVAGSTISSEASALIERTMNELVAGNTRTNKLEEIERIREVCQDGSPIEVKPTRVDLKLVSNDGQVYLIDLKTAKPNINEFKEYKRTLLQWVAASLYQDPNLQIHTLLAMPYNPYEPEPYERWTKKSLIDTDHELMVGKQFWDFLAGAGTYELLLGAFETVGIEMRDEIDARFAELE